MPIRRMKTYTGATGAVYQYYFVGQRPALPGAAAGAATEYIFDVTADRVTTFAASVFVTAAALNAWEREHGRALIPTEQYAAAKMRLFAAFDEVERLIEQRNLVVDAENIAGLLEPLNLL